MPQLGETVTEGTVTLWHKKPGEHVSPSEALFEVSTDKVDTEVPAPSAGILAEIRVQAGATVKVGTILAVITEEGGACATTAASVVDRPIAAASAAATQTSKRAWAPKRDGRGRPLSPVVRRLIAEHGIAPDAVRGTGAEGRITRRDVLAALAQAGRPQARAPLAAGPVDDRIVVPFSKIRRRTAEHMVRSKAISPHVLQAVEVDFQRIERLRATAQETWRAGQGFSLTYLPFVAHALAGAIAEFPHVNATIEGHSLVVFKRVNLGIAVDLGAEGLIVPVVKDAARLGLADLARAIRDISQRARVGRLGPDDLTQGTYTISNSGVFGTMITAPIINQPQVAILSMDGVKKRAWVVEGPEGDSIAIRPIGIIAQCFDHRAIDGAYSAAFLRRLKEILETRDWARDIGHS